MSDIEIHHLGAAYALDALDERERTAYEAHYSTCEICRTDVREYRATAAELATLSTSTQPPPSDLKSRVMAEVATTRQLSPLPASVVRLADRRPRRALTVALSVAAAVVFFVAGALVLGNRGDDSFGDQLAEMVDEPGFGMVQLDGEGGGSFKVAWTADQAAVVADRLPDPGAGKRYELWMIDAAGAHPMDMLDPADGGQIRRVVTVDGEPAAWGVTIEPASGSQVPTEPILYVAEVPASSA